MTRVTANFAVSHVTPRRSFRTLRAVWPVFALAVAVAVAGVLAALLSGGSGTTGSSSPSLRATQAALCKALGTALHGAMDVTRLNTGHDGNVAVCTALDAHYNAVSLYGSVSMGASGKTAYLANVRKDKSSPGYGCSQSDQGPLDITLGNSLTRTTQAYGCDIALGTSIIGERVDALTTGGRYVSVSLVSDPTSLKRSAFTIAQLAIRQLAKQ